MEDAVFPENALRLFIHLYTSFQIMVHHSLLSPMTEIVSVCIYHTGKCEYADQGTSKGSYTVAYHAMSGGKQPLFSIKSHRQAEHQIKSGGEYLQRIGTEHQYGYGNDGCFGSEFNG